MQGISGFSPINLNTTVERTFQQDSSIDARFLQNMIEIACGQKAENPTVYAGQGSSQPDFFANPEKAIGLNGQKNEKSIDDILAEIEKILSQLRDK